MQLVNGGVLRSLPIYLGAEVTVPGPPVGLVVDPAGMAQVLWCEGLGRRRVLLAHPGQYIAGTFRPIASVWTQLGPALLVELGAAEIAQPPERP